MEREEATTSSGLYGGRGAGGKYRKPLARKTPATPYDRPQAANHSRRDGGGAGWLSRFATRILPSFISKSLPYGDPPTVSEDQDLPLEQATSIDGQENTYSLELATSPGVEGPNKPVDRSSYDSDLDDREEDTTRGLGGDNKLCEIEKMLKEKKFSSEEISRLTKILDSKIVDSSMDVNPQAVRTIVPQDGQRMSVPEKQKFLNGVSPEMSSPQPTSMHQAMVGASPIEIARAYMGTRTSDVDPAYKSMALKDRALQLSDEFASKPLVPSSLLKSSTCWPGAVIQDKRDYVTPQSQKGSFGLCNFPRTPYSRAIYSKSKTKLLQSHGGEPSNILTTPLPALQSRTPTYGGLKYSRRDSLNGSVGPIRRTRQKLALETNNGSDRFHSSEYGPLLIGSSSTSERMLPTVKKNLEIGATTNTSKYQSMDRKEHGSKPDVSAVRPQSSQLARSIYEHLDRSIVTPKGMSAELDIATTLKKPRSSEIMTNVSKDYVSLGQTGSCNSNKNMDVVDTSLSAQGNQDEQNPLRKAQQNERISKSFDSAKRNTSVSDAACSPAGAVSSLEIVKTHGSQFAGTNEVPAAGHSGSRQEDNSHPGPLFNQSNGKLASKEDGNGDAQDFINWQNKPPLHSSRVKRGLSSISIEKPGSRGTAYMETSTGFSFPVSVSSCALSEPPTPSILPSSTAGDLHPPEVGSASPSYGFGSKRSSPPVVFDFPFTASSAITRDNASDIKFNFGSDIKKGRVCFSLVGKNGLS